MCMCVCVCVCDERVKISDVFKTVHRKTAYEEHHGHIHGRERETERERERQ